MRSSPVAGGRRPKKKSSPQIRKTKNGLLFYLETRTRERTARLDSAWLEARLEEKALNSLTLNSQLFDPRRRLSTLNSQLSTPNSSRLPQTRDSRLATRDSRLATCGSQRLSKVLDSTRRHGTGLAETLTRLDGTTTELDSRLTRFATRRTARRLADSTRLDSSSTAWPRHKSLATTQPGGEIPCRFLKYACLLQTATRIYPPIILNYSLNIRRLC